MIKKVPLLVLDLLDIEYDDPMVINANNANTENPNNQNKRNSYWNILLQEMKRTYWRIQHHRSFGFLRWC